MYVLLGLPQAEFRNTVAIWDEASNFLRLVNLSQGVGIEAQSISCAAKRMRPFLGVRSSGRGGRQSSQKITWIVSQSGVFWPKSGTGLGLTSAILGTLDGARSPCPFPPQGFPADVKSAS